MNKKGQMGAAVAGLTSLATIVLLFVVIGMIAAFGSDIVADTQNDLLTGTAGCNSTTNTACGQAYNNTVNANDSIQNMTAKMPTVATVLIGAFIILILIAAFGGFIALRN